MENSKRTIAIVCGGDSSEHDVSLRSGQGLYSFFDKERYNIYLVDVKGTDWHVALDNGETIEIDKNDFSFVMNGKHVYFDYAYITIHGQPGENGVMQGYFDLIHLPYSTSGVLVEAMTFDKYVLNNYLRGFGINVADSILLRRGEAYDEEEIAIVIFYFLHKIQDEFLGNLTTSVHALDVIHYIVIALRFSVTQMHP